MRKSEINESYLFIQALAAHVDRLQVLLGRDWPDFQVRLQWLLASLDQTTEQPRLLLIIDQILEIGLKSLAAGLVRSLFKQAREQATAFS